MSRTIDQRVVEMRFDNKQFESGVSTTMSTLEKLKQKLNFSGAAKGLEEVGASTKKVDMSGLAQGVETVSAKFSALQVIGITALSNITNQAVNAGKRMVSALTIDPIKTGFSEYETQINAVQTILANTSNKGSTIDDVNKALDELNVYADKTIYNFTEMTRNIGTFTAAGVDLNTSVSAIQGIANLAAVSGSTSQQASTAMYQLSQALSSGTVKLMDWNSVVNAGMGGEVFQNALKNTARIHGVAIDAMIENEGSFRETLKNEWLTSEILTETLNNFTLAAEEGSDAWNEYKKTLMSRGYTEAQAVDILKMANTATDAATKVKTFTQLWDVMKESAQSGWSQTWKLLIGDFEEAKGLLTPLATFLTDAIGRMSEARNKLLESALGKGFANSAKRFSAILNTTKDGVNGILKPVAFAKEGIDNLTKPVKVASEALENFDEVVNKVIRGDYGSGVDRYKALTDAGLNYYSIQNKINEELGSSFRYSEEQIAEQDKALGNKKELTTELTAANKELLKSLVAMSDEQLKAAGYTETQIAAFRDLEKQANKLGIPLGEFIDNLEQINGRWLLINSFKNVGKSLITIFNSMRDAWREVFDPITADNLFNIIAAIHKFTTKLMVSEETAGKLKRIFKGVFSLLDIGRKIIISIGSSIAKLLGSDGVSSFADMLLDTAASIGDFFTSLNEGFDANGISGVLTKIVSGISDLLFGASEHMKSFGDVFSFIGTTISKVANGIWKAFKTVFGWISDNVSIGDVFAGLAGGGLFAAGAGILKGGSSISKFFKGIPDAIKDIFGLGDGDGIISKFKDVLDSAKEALSSFATGIKVTSLVSIAIAVGILSVSMRAISELNAEQIVKSLLSIGVMLGMLSITMKSMTKTLSGFGSKGLVKAGISLIAVAAAVSILASAMKKISELSVGELIKSLVGIGIALGILVAGLKLIGKLKISLSTSVAILALAKSCDILADALVKFGQMSWDEIGRGLAAMGGALTELVIAMSVLNKFGGGKSIAGSVAILIAVQSLSKMADGLKKFGQMSWDEIGRGLAAMGGALLEVGAVLAVVGKIAGFSSLFAAGAILIVTQGLDEMAEALAMFADMSWSEIGRGLTAMGGALIEVGAVLVAVGKIAGFSSLFAAGAIFIVIQGLDEMAEAFRKFGEMSWDVIGRGLTAMGGALLEVGVVLAGVGKIAGFSSLFAAGAIFIVIQGLGDLADALSRFGQMPWDEIGRGLVAMGGALAEAGIIVGGLGILAGFSSLFAAGSILIVIQGLGDLADSFKKFGEMAWDEIGRGLVGMGGALLEVGVITGALGAIAGLPALLGGGAILLAVQGLGDLADAFKKFGEMSWDEIKQGLAAMGGALGELAIGGALNTFALLGDLGIALVAEPLGKLADSVKKWTDVVIPDGLTSQLTLLAGAVTAWTFSAIGSASLALAASPLGILADSVRKWTGVVIPEGLADQLALLATAVTAWTFSGIGAASLAAAAEPVGTLADSVKKWSGVYIPEGLQEGLVEIADGVKAFTWAFMGGWSLDALAGPLGDLGDSIKKWNGVYIPDGLGEDLAILADGVKAFSWAFMGGWSLGAITGPLGEFADSVKKWNGVSIPNDLGEDLEILADGIKAFSWAFVAGWSLGSLTGPLGELADSVKKWNGVYIPDGLANDLTGLATGVRSFSGITDISIAVNALSKIASSAEKLSGIKFSSISSGLNGLTSSIKNLASVGSVSESFAKFGKDLVNGVITPIKNASGQFAALGSNIVTMLANGVTSRQSMMVGNISAIMTQTLMVIRSKQGLFNSAGKNIADSLSSGVSSKTSRVLTVFIGTLLSAVVSIKLQYSNFKSAGKYLGDGLIEGINAKKQAVYNAAYALGQKAVQGEKDGQQSKSPSKATIKAGRWLGEGLIIGMKQMASSVYKSGGNLGKAATNNISDAISDLSNVINSDLDAQPTIRPVMDLSDVKSGVNAIGSMMNMGTSVGVMANVGSISSMMNSRIQNGTNDDVISAINKLGEGLSNIGGTSYNINGITYDDNSSTSDAIKALVRAIGMERRV